MNKSSKKPRYPTLPVAYDARGASMGRRDCIMEPDAEIRFRLYRMPMSACGCYDSGGAYWGASSSGVMYHAIGEGPDYVNEMFVRAPSREKAKETVLKAFPKASFYR